MKALKIQGLVLMVVAVSSIGALAQGNSARTVTNADLEKYRAARVKADEDYRQNYQKRGMPSPEELDRRQEERQKNEAEASNELRRQRLQNEYNDYVRALAASYSTPAQPQVVYVERNNGYGSGFYVVNPYWWNRGSTRRGKWHNNTGVGFGPNVQMVRDAGSMFPNTDSIRNKDIIRREPRRR